MQVKEEYEGAHIDKGPHYQADPTGEGSLRVNDAIQICSWMLCGTEAFGAVSMFIG